MWYNRLILLFLIAFSITIMGCSQEEDSASPRTQSYVLTATQDARNVLKYQFKVTHQGRELTSSDASFLWNFGDAAGTSTEAAPAYEYVEKGERKVSVSIIMNSDENGVSERVSQDTIILVGEQSSIHDSIITAYAGEGTKLLDYKLISSAIASEETGGALNYLWKVTGPDGENGAIKTTTYPQEGEEPITTNTINHTFKKFGYNYNVDLYIKSADAAEYDMSSPTANLYLTTALPTISISCESLGKQNNQEKVRCTPNFDYDIKYGITHGMQYRWTFYSADGSSTVKDGEATSTGDKPEVEFSYSTAGTKLITIEGTHPTGMIGTAKGSVTVVLSSAGILNPITCYRPTDNLGNFTDKTKLQYVCEAQGYYNSKTNMSVPLPLTSYTWKITEDGTNYQQDSYGWGTGDVVGADKTYGTANPVTTRVDCDEAKNICTTTLKFTADKYGAQYQVSLSATQNDQDTAGITYNLNTAPVLVNVEMPKITGITRTTSEANPMQSVFTPTYDTEIPTSKTLNYYWSIQGTKTAASTSTTDTWYESGNNITYDGQTALTARTLTHTFSQSANYAIVLRIASEFFSNGKSGTEHGTVDMPSLTGTENTLNFELNQSIAGSYFTFSINNITNQVRFFTDYEARVGGQPVDTTYVFTITGPTYTHPGRPNQANTVVLHNVKEFETISPKEVTETVTNNVRLIYGATYTVQLEVWNKAVYDSNRTNGKVENATYKLVNLTSGATGNNQFTTKRLTIEKGLKEEMQTHWWETLTPKIYYTEGTTNYNIDLSLFTCSVALTDPNNIMRVGTTIPFDYNSATKTITTDCNNVFYINGNGQNFRDTLTGTLTITGPYIDPETNTSVEKALPISIRYIPPQ